MATEIVPQRAPSLLTPIRELHHAWGRLDALVGGLPAGRIALVESPDYGLLHALATGYLVQALGSFPEPVAYVDGGNSINPYAVADLGLPDAGARARLLGGLSAVLRVLLLGRESLLRRGPGGFRHRPASWGGSPGS